MASFTPEQIEQFLQEFFDVVGRRQYIGARYVPIFGRKGEGTIEWDNSAPYEPLTVVMHNGVSYVSKQYVPADVDITDEAYWAETYRFNAQVEQYRQEVLRFNERIDANRDAIAAETTAREQAINNTLALVEDDYVPFPDSDTYPKYGTLGQVLTTLTNGSTKWVDPVVPSDAQAESVITAWLNAHPEATTTVQDGSVTDAKLYPNGILKRSDALMKAVHNIDTFIGFYTAADKPTISHSGSDIVVSFGASTVNMRILTISGEDGSYGFYNRNYAYSEPITVPSTNYLIYDMANRTFSTVPFASFIPTSDTVVCFYNSVGNMIGPWMVYENDYRIRDISANLSTAQTDITNLTSARSKDFLFDIDFCTALGFYGEGSIPSLNRDGQNIIVRFNTASNGIRGLSRNASGDFTLINRTYNYTDPITVPHNNFLIFNTATSAFDVVHFNDFVQADNLIVCFFNSAGNVVGNWNVYRILTMLQQADADTLPAYYDEYLPEKIDTINTHLMEGFDVISFAFVTDIHWADNAKQSPKLIREIAKNTNLGYVVLNGDYIGEESTKDAALAETNKVCAMYAGNNWLTYRVCGNHEYNNPSSSHPEHELTVTELEHSILTGTVGLVEHDGCSSLVKDPIRNVYFFLMECGATSGVSYDTRKFFARCLRDSIPQNATVILCAHRLNGITDVYEIIDAYNARSTITIEDTTFDFANSNGKLVAGFTGHVHEDAQYVTSGGVPIFTTTCDAMLELGSLTRSVGTVTEQAFDVVTINTNTKTVNLTRIGAGEDRTYTWS